MLIAIAQVAFIAFWWRTYMEGLLSTRMLHIRTIASLGYGWFAAANGIPADTLPAVLSQLLAWLHVGGLCMAMLNRDSRFFLHRYGGCQEN